MSQKKTERVQHHGFKLEEVSIEDEFFTKERILEWKVFISECCRDVCNALFDKLDIKSGVCYFVNKALIEESIYDAIIGMKKIINSSPNPVVKPNIFKISAYLSYWFLRHKPISILFNLKTTDMTGKAVIVDFKDLVIPKDGIDKDYLIWQLNHINEMVAVGFASSFIFDFSQVVCDDKRCKFIIKESKKNSDASTGKNGFFGFSSFEEQREFITDKLTYYFSYRAIAPKVIEHILEGYAFHPAWQLTGAHWNTHDNTEGSESKTEE